MIIRIFIIHVALNLIGGILNSISGAVSGICAGITGLAVSTELFIFVFEIRFFVKIYLATRKLDQLTTGASPGSEAKELITSKGGNLRSKVEELILPDHGGCATFKALWCHVS